MAWEPASNNWQVKSANQNINNPQGNLSATGFWMPKPNPLLNTQYDAAVKLNAGKAWWYNWKSGTRQEGQPLTPDQEVKFKEFYNKVKAGTNYNEQVRLFTEHSGQLGYDLAGAQFNNPQVEAPAEQTAQAMDTPVSNYKPGLRGGGYKTSDGQTYETFEEASDAMRVAKGGTARYNQYRNPMTWDEMLNIGKDRIKAQGWTKIGPSTWKGSGGGPAHGGVVSRALGNNKFYRPTTTPAPTTPVPSAVAPNDNPSLTPNQNEWKNYGF